MLTEVELIIMDAMALVSTSPVTELAGGKVGEADNAYKVKV